MAASSLLSIGMSSSITLVRRSGARLMVSLDEYPPCSSLASHLFWIVQFALTGTDRAVPYYDCGQIPEKGDAE